MQPWESISNIHDSKMYLLRLCSALVLVPCWFDGLRRNVAILTDGVGEQLGDVCTWSLKDLEHPNNTLAEGVGCKRFPQLEMASSGHYHIVFMKVPSMQC